MEYNGETDVNGGWECVDSIEARCHAAAYTAASIDELDEDWKEERWCKGPVQTDRLRTAFSEKSNKDGRNRNASYVQNGLMNDILAQNRLLIGSDDFPRSKRIRNGAGQKPAIMIECDSDGEMFVVDGQGRVFAALWHGEAEIDAFIFARPGEPRILP